MEARLALIGGFLLALLVAQTRAVDDNYALNGPSFQYDAYDDNCTLPSKAVDGSLLQDMNACQCAQTGSLSYLPYKPWWVVKLRRWLQVSSFRVIGSQTANETRDGGYSFLVGPFWNESLPSVVPWNGLTSDPIKGQGFSLLYQLNGVLHDFPNASTTFNVSFGGAGRFFAVQSSFQPVMFCEVQVFGKESLLSGNSAAFSLVSDNLLYQSYNTSVLTDDREDTCLQLGSVKAGQTVFLQSVSAVPGQLSVVIVSKGGLQGQNSRSCQSNMSLRVSNRRTKSGAWADDYSCKFVLTQTQPFSSLMTYRFECDCKDCLPMITVSLEWSGVGVSQTVDICEILVFPRSIPSADASALSTDVSTRPDCDPSGKYCCPKQQIYSIKYAFWPIYTGGLPIANGTVTLPQYQMNFTKAFDYTDLRVIFSGDVRCRYGCCRLFLTYNGNECLDPAPTEMITYNDATTIFWMSTIEGICSGIPAGNVMIMLNSAQCSSSASWTHNLGRDGPTKLMAEETEPPLSNLTPSCLHAAAFNTRQYISNGTGVDNGTIFTTNYTKSAAETALKLTFQGTTKVTTGSGDRCGVWQFFINGLACSNPGPIMGTVGQDVSGNRDLQNPTMFNGVCYGIASGPLVVTLVVGTCVGYTTAADLYTGYLTATHILIEEVRENTPFISPKATPAFNLRNYFLNLSTDANTGLLASVSFIKTRSDTALRVSWIGNVRLTTSLPYATTYISGWVIRFNNQTCADPGVINHSYAISMSSVGHPLSSLRTGRNFGICRGIGAGNVNVSMQAEVVTAYSDTLANITTSGGV